eukprot:9345947-Pyramimonas_sp.AAC.1
MSSERRAFSAIDRISRDARNPDRWRQEVRDGLRDLNLRMMVALRQQAKGRHFAFERPLYVGSWGAPVI